MAAVGLTAILVFVVLQIYAGYLGIAHHIGVGWAIAAVVLALIFRFALPVTIGAFFGAINVWDWHWMAAAAFAAPSLLFLIPGTIAGVVSMSKRRWPLFANNRFIYNEV